MIFNYASYTDIGQVRGNNEDYHIVIPFDEHNELLLPLPTVWAVIFSVR